LKTTIFVIVLLLLGYFLLPYVKIKPKPAPVPSSQQSANTDSIQTFSSDDFGVKFKYNQDQDGDGKLDTAVKEVGDKIYVYYSQMPPEQGQWVQKFSKD